MVFRRPRVNVKPNVQATRPVSNSLQSQETSNESVPVESQEQQIDVPAISPTITEPIPNVEEIIEPPLLLPPPPPQFDPLPMDPPPVSEPLPMDPPTVSDPLPMDPPLVSTPLLVPPSSPPPPVSIPTVRPLFRKKIAPNIGVKTAIHHRRPSASCSGTESESESSRQKHSTASSITFGRIPQPITKPNLTNETQLNIMSDVPINGDITTPTKAEMMTTEISEIHTPPIDNNSHNISIPSLPTRMNNTKISREYISQHINYRAQRLASKIEPDMTIRKRRAATLEKLDETGFNKGQPIDTSKLKIADFVHYNPADNPMDIKIKTAITDITTDPVRKHSISSTDGQNSSVAPQLKIDANGALVVDEESLYIRNMDDTPRNTVIVEGQFNDDNLTHQSYRKIGRRKRWNNRDTLRFYQALRMCGTDFTLISRVFPNRNRDDIKRKFKTEDKANRTLIDSALSQRIPFDLTCFYSPSEESSDDENGSDAENVTQKKPKKRRLIKRKSKQVASSSDPLEINRRREKRLQAKKNSTRVKKSVEFINDDDDDDDENNEDDNSMDVADTVEVMTSKAEQIIPSTQNDEDTVDNSLTNIAELENLLGGIDGSHLLFVHNTDETTGLDRIDVHVVMPNVTDNNTEQSI
ncbi:unnamed protein product [Adineta steineri]|uniref:Myb-like domain-containing protein n=1 Tax=Adineta steineri TaxID=433720 RepID=A0A814I0T3_9BILA|nr:unnamed protein product [Adineta steineri]CAF3544376.1 unnamed protein product [Adineta steineri]